MPTKQTKQAVVAGLSEQLDSAQIALVVAYNKLTVQDLTKFRKALSKAKCTVVKNTLLDLAVEGTPLKPLQDFLKGTSLLVTSPEDPSELIKNFFTHSKEFKEKLVLKGGAMVGETAALTQEQIEAISKLPSREMILAQIAGALTATPSQIVSTINQLIGGIGELAVKVAEQKGN